MPNSICSQESCGGPCSASSREAQRGQSPAQGCTAGQWRGLSCSWSQAPSRAPPAPNIPAEVVQARGWASWAQRSRLEPLWAEAGELPPLSSQPLWLQAQLDESDQLSWLSSALVTSQG